MISRTLILSLFVAAGGPDGAAARRADAAVASSFARNNNLRASTHAIAGSSSSSSVANSRRLEDPPSTQAIATTLVESSLHQDDERDEDGGGEENIDQGDETSANFPQGEAEHDGDLDRETAGNDFQSSNETSSSSSSAMIGISQRCLATLKATANENGKLKKENYFYFTDAMSNGYFTFHNYTEYSDLPMQNKFAYVTLSCRCQEFGGMGNCCQGDRAKIDVLGIIDSGEGFDTVDEQLRAYVADVCTMTRDAIGEENMLPPTGEGVPESRGPTMAPTASYGPSVVSTYSAAPTGRPSFSSGPSSAPSSSPSSGPSSTLSSGPSSTPTAIVSASPSTVPSVISLLPIESRKPDNRSLLPVAAWAGIIAAGGLALFIACIFCYGWQKRKDGNDDKDVDPFVGGDGNNTDAITDATSKQLVAKGGTVDAGVLVSGNSPDTTSIDSDSPGTLTVSPGSEVGSSVRSAAITQVADKQSGYYARNGLQLPGLASNDDNGGLIGNGPNGEPAGLLEDEESAIADEGGAGSAVDLSPRGESMHRAVGSGDWMEVATSAAVFVKEGEPLRSAQDID
eukprot:CAMPEP_0181099608 /NCGR_PEP_ID=MMETSP1071-20121207/12750_1 /TAXON_ID=35127 /ORGANISM="Thalassiosira sp., Strain NH16" /LENGTH=568 /DNA_ID=CAMNT_0023182281 /DNA_START=94 /DNA_END=1800 /DNA_ORIENTATION=-